METGLPPTPGATPTPEPTPGTGAEVSKEMTVQEMLFLVSAHFYAEASNLGQQALEAKNEAFVVIKNANNPEVKAAKDAAEAEVSALDKEEAGYTPGPEEFDEEPTV